MCYVCVLYVFLDGETFKPATEAMIVPKGEPVELPCSVFPVQPVTWKRNGQIVTSIADDIHTSDAARLQYQCWQNNVLLKTVDVTVQGKKFWLSIEQRW